MFALSFFFEALVNQLSQLDQGVLDALGVLIDLTLCVYCDVRCVSSASMAQIVLSKLSAPALKRVLALRCTLGLHVVFHGGREVKVVLACTTSMHLSRINCLSSHVLRLTKVRLRFLHEALTVLKARPIQTIRYESTLIDLSNSHLINLHDCIIDPVLYLCLQKVNVIFVLLKVVHMVSVKTASI